MSFFYFLLFSLVKTNFSLNLYLRKNLKVGQNGSKLPSILGLGMKFPASKCQNSLISLNIWRKKKKERTRELNFWGLLRNFINKLMEVKWWVWQMIEEDNLSSKIMKLFKTLMRTMTKTTILKNRLNSIPKKSQQLPSQRKRIKIQTKEEKRKKWMKILKIPHILTCFWKWSIEKI